MKNLEISTKEISESVSVPIDTFERYASTHLYGILGKHISNKMLETIDGDYSWLKDVNVCNEEITDVVNSLVEQLDSYSEVEKSYRNHIVVSAKRTETSIVFKMFDTITI